MESELTNALAGIFQSAKQTQNFVNTKNSIETTSDTKQGNSLKMDKSSTNEETKRDPMSYKSPQKPSNRQFSSHSPKTITPGGGESDITPINSKTLTKDYCLEKNETNKIISSNQKNKEIEKDQDINIQRCDLLETKHPDQHLERKVMPNKGFTLSPERKNIENPIVNISPKRKMIENPICTQQSSKIDARILSESKVSDTKEAENFKNKYIPQKPSILQPTAKNIQYQIPLTTQGTLPNQISKDTIIPESNKNGALQTKTSSNSSFLNPSAQNQLSEPLDFQKKTNISEKINPISEEQEKMTLTLNALSNVFSGRQEDEKIDDLDEIKMHELPQMQPIRYIEIEGKKTQADLNKPKYTKYSALYDFRNKKIPNIPQPKNIGQKKKNEINYDPIFDFIINFKPAPLSYSSEEMAEISDAFIDAAQYAKEFLPWFYEELKEHALHGFNLIDKAKFVCCKLHFTKAHASFRNNSNFDFKFQNHDIVVVIPLEYNRLPLFSSYINSDREYKTGIIVKNKKENFKILLKNEQNIDKLNAKPFNKEEENELNKWNSIENFAVVFIEKLVPDMREFKALKVLPSFNLLNYILNPTPPIKSELSKYSVEFLYKNKQFFNESQYSAIREILQVKEGISLLQGPPGTGKTRTIMGLISGFFENLKGIKRPRILVCAPSNIAIDEIALRIIRDGLLVEGRSINDIYPVRIGKRNGWEDDKDLNYEQPDEVKHIRLDFLAEKNLSLKGINNPLIEIEALKSQVDKYNEKLRFIKENTTEKSQILSSIQSLKSKISRLQDKLQEYNTQKNTERTNIRNKANIILCTLSGAGSEALQTATSFDYIIIDEACQCIELSCIIPFQYGAKHAVLVGDPNQLPATIFSKSAVDHNYSRSLFERLYANSAIQCHFLSIQYRMNKEICDFPNKFFYNERLECEPGFFENRKVPEWIPPLNTVFINLEISEESRIGNEMSFKNNPEAAFIADLYDFIKRSFSNQKIDLGIITPYRKQVEKIEEELNIRHSGWDKHMEINTVDGFQGREKDVIILSLVRTTNVGFLIDKRRMNVSLTRAKFGLWVVGNAFCLENDESWANFMGYCKENNKFISCSSFHEVYTTFARNSEGEWNGISKVQESESQRQDEEVQRFYNSWEEC